MSTASAAFPGFGAPAAGFDEPFAMLSACHERVERSLRLLARVVTHVAAAGSDRQAQDAATDVLRYFDIAAPLHHDDEERHVFPPLLAAGEADIVARVRRMQQDHQRMAAAWPALRAHLLAVKAGQVPGAGFADAAAAFAALYGEHIETEETLLYPAAARIVDGDALQAMGDDMRRRRTVSPA